MALGDRIRILRSEKGWAQAELAERIGADARRISHYENSRTMPTLESARRLAEVFDVSLDFLILEDVPRRPLKADDGALLERLEDIRLLSKEDRASLLHILDALIARTKLKAFAEKL